MPLKVIAFANTFAIIDLVLHPFFHLWISVAPRSYEWAMNLFVAGLHLQVIDLQSAIKIIELVAAKEKLEIVSGAAPPPFRIFAGGLPRPALFAKRAGRNAFGLIQEYCIETNSQFTILILNEKNKNIF